MNGTVNIKLAALDSNIFIYQFESNPEYIEITNSLFDQITKNKFKAVTSVISLIEALSYPSPPEVIAAITNSFQSMRNLTVVDINQEIGYQAARIRREYKYLMPDAVQLATALVAKADIFITNDARLKSFKEQKIILLSEF